VEKGLDMIGCAKRRINRFLGSNGEPEEIKTKFYSVNKEKVAE